MFRLAGPCWDGIFEEYCNSHSCWCLMLILSVKIRRSGETVAPIPYLMSQEDAGRLVAHRYASLPRRCTMIVSSISEAILFQS